MFGSALEFNNYFGETKKVIYPEDLKNVDALILWGGEDISPYFYRQTPVMTNAPEVPSHRDKLEKALVMEAVRLGIPILGICRGAQLLCALHGGSLWQHVENHDGKDHEIEVNINGKVVTGITNSYHHQMMIPDRHAKILATVPRFLSPRKWKDHATALVAGPDPGGLGIEPEIVWFPKFRALGVQGHPEWLPNDSFLTKVTKQLFEELTNETWS